ncbi:MAG: hypothetical protein HRT37_08205 [Alteromonadaceae bacterium]|nr:hypothetical protein [Alteromonadaceae bacterium]
MSATHGNPSTTAVKLPEDFTNNFPSYFNPNEATVYLRNEMWNGHKTLRFLLHAKLFGYNNVACDAFVPDVHADWVGLQRKHLNGFTVQTLKRNFTTGLDWAAAGVTVFIGGIATVALTAVSAGAATVPVGAASTAATIGAFELTKYHFLAGRRSWVIGTKESFGRANVEKYDQIPDDAIVLETAAVERISGRFMQMGAKSSIIGNFDKLIHKVWIKLLLNYAQSRLAKGDEILSVNVWGENKDKVSFYEPVPVSDRSALEGNSDIKDMLRCGHAELLP